MITSPKYFSLVIFLTIYKTIKKDKMIFDKQTEKLYHCIHIFINRKKVSNDILPISQLHICKPKQDSSFVNNTRKTILTLYLICNLNTDVHILI